MGFPTLLHDVAGSVEGFGRIYAGIYIELCFFCLIGVVKFHTLRRYHNGQHGGLCDIGEIMFNRVASSEIANTRSIPPARRVRVPP